MTLIGPAIPTALLHAPEGKREVHPAMDEWWLNLQPLRRASREGALSCPDCGGRLVFCVENLPTPYFKHYRGSCLLEGEGEAGDRSRPSGGRSSWFRHHLVTALRRILPGGTRVACGDFLFARSQGMRITLPDGRGFQLEVVHQPLDLETWAQKSLACEQEGVPLFFLFTGDRIPAGLPITPGPAATVVTLQGLNADHDAIALPLPVDIAHALREDGYRLPTLETLPRTLFFFQPGRRRDDSGTLAILRGLLPDPRQTGTWHGRLVTAPMVGDGKGPVRFSLRHGFYTEADLAVLNGARRRLRPVPPGPVRPLLRAWEAEAAARREPEAVSSAARRRPTGASLNPTAPSASVGAPPQRVHLSPPTFFTRSEKSRNTREVCGV